MTTTAMMAAMAKHAIVLLHVRAEIMVITRYNNNNMNGHILGTFLPAPQKFCTNIFFLQSCIECHVYATCSNGDLYDNRPCPADLAWDDNKKRCQYTSDTCPGIGDCGGQGGDVCDCITSCEGLADGDYQSCLGELLVFAFGETVN